MKIMNFLLAAVLASGATSVSAQGLWARKADFPAGKSSYCTGFSIGAKGYVGTGLDSALTRLAAFWEYDPATDSWTQVCDFGGGARSSAAGFSIGNKGYVGTGISANGVEKDLWEFDPFLNSWTQKADFGGVGRCSATGFSIGSKGYIGTGDTTLTGDYIADFWEYDPVSDSWSPLPAFPGVGRAPGVGFSIGTKGYFGSGNSAVDDLPTRDFWEYDPATLQWTRKADLPIGKCGATGFAVGGKGYVGTGVDSLPGYPHSTTFFQYDPVADSWMQVADLPGMGRNHAVGFAIGSKGYVSSGGFQTDHYEFDPDAANINENVLSVQIIAYPNPVTDVATFLVQNGVAYKNISFRLYDVAGHLIRTEDIELPFKFHRNALQAGTYVYTLSEGAAILSRGKLTFN